jgi:hypothetical protein|tara:strand:- start:5089 stop:5373 length:285 start_codon:yes stop_codon:yes gene_type:complete
MWNEILVGLGAGATFFVSAFSLGKFTMRKAWKKNELELRNIQKDLIELQSLDPDNHGVNEILKELDNYFLEFYSEDHFDWSWKNNKDNKKNKNV